jgi:hypothetical protein
MLISHRFAPIDTDKTKQIGHKKAQEAQKVNTSLSLSVKSEPTYSSIFPLVPFVPLRG